MASITLKEDKFIIFYKNGKSTAGFCKKGYRIENVKVLAEGKETIRIEKTNGETFAVKKIYVDITGYTPNTHKQNSDDILNNIPIVGKIMDGYYSQKRVDNARFGESNITHYNPLYGDAIVEVTNVVQEGNPHNCKWDDIRFVGKVIKCIKSANYKRLFK